jgi:hypothetical protein
MNRIDSHKITVSRFQRFRIADSSSMKAISLSSARTMVVGQSKKQAVKWVGLARPERRRNHRSWTKEAFPVDESSMGGKTESRSEDEVNLQGTSLFIAK